MSDSTHEQNPNPQEDPSVTWQKTRFQLYTLAATVVSLLIVSNILDRALESQIMSIVNLVLTVVGLALPLVTSIMARRNANPSNVTVLPVAAASVETVATTEGTTVAGPASALKTGTVVNKAA